MAAADDDPRRGFLPLLVPVEGHVVVCQGCGSLVLDNRNALSAHRDDHAAREPKTETVQPAATTADLSGTASGSYERADGPVWAGDQPVVVRGGFGFQRRA